jgi:spore coat polysaccharide biosynthesis predicted glycosyltransferase SpsG
MDAMTRNPILFRCDGGPCGWESFYQCLVLAAAMQRRRRGTYLFGRLDPPTLAGSIRRAGHDWLPADAPVGSPEDIRQTAKEVRRLQAAAVVVAGHDLSPDYLAELVSLGVLVVAVDSQATAHFPNHLVINPLLAPAVSSYSHARGTQLLVGGRYSLIRPALRRMRPLRSQEPPAPFRVMLTLGDDDPAGQSLERVNQLLGTSRLERIDVAVRPHHRQLDELRALAEANPGRLEVLTEPAEVGLRIPRCHMAITAGDSWSLELACVGVPQLMMVMHDRHLANAQRLEEEGVGTLLGGAADVTATHLRQAVQSLLTDSAERVSMARSGRQLIDGRGPDRIVVALEVLMHPARPAQAERAAA